MEKERNIRRERVTFFFFFGRRREEYLKVNTVVIKIVHYASRGVHRNVRYLKKKLVHQLSKFKEAVKIISKTCLTLI